MTHDGLLARIDKIEEDACWYQQRGDDCDGMHSVIRSLRAVLELCKKYGADYYLEDFADRITQAIEKELVS